MLGRQLGTDETVSARSADDAGAALIRRFYAAANEVLRTGDAAALGDLVAPGLVEHPTRAGLPGGRDGLVAALRSARAAAPALLLVVDEATSQGDRVTAVLHAEGVSEAAFLGIPLGAAYAPWGSIDVFRIADGAIAEHWGVPVPAATFASLAEATVAIPPAPVRALRVERRTYPPGARDTAEADGPVLLLAERGTLTVAVERAAAAPARLIHRAPPTGRAGAGEPIGPADRAVLVPGDLLVLPQGSRFRAVNYEDAPSTVLVVAVHPPEVPAGGDAPDQRPVAPGGAHDAPGSAGITTEPLALAWGLGEDLPVEAVVRIGRIALGPGAVVPPHAVGGAEVLLVEGGAVALTSAGESAWIARGDPPGTSWESATVLEPGAGVIVTDGASAAYEAAGPDAATVLVVTIAPAAPS